MRGQRPTGGAAGSQQRRVSKDTFHVYAYHLHNFITYDYHPQDIYIIFYWTVFFFFSKGKCILTPYPQFGKYVISLYFDFRVEDTKVMRLVIVLYEKCDLWQGSMCPTCQVHCLGKMLYLVGRPTGDKRDYHRFRLFLKLPLKVRKSLPLPQHGFKDP